MLGTKTGVARVTETAMTRGTETVVTCMKEDSVSQGLLIVTSET